MVCPTASRPMRVTTPNFHGQVLTEDRHLFAIRRTNMRGKISLSTLSHGAANQTGANREAYFAVSHGKPLRSSFRRNASRRLTPSTVPACRGSLQSFAAHGLHGVTAGRSPPTCPISVRIVDISPQERH